MYKSTVVLLIIFLVTLAGCAAMNRLAPSELDEQGNPIPGTHQLNPTAQAVAGNLGPWGSAAAAIPLLIWNFVELVKAKKDQKGLIATVKAINQVKNDPELAKQWELIKSYLENAHSVAGVDAAIKKILAKI